MRQKPAWQNCRRPGYPGARRGRRSPGCRCTHQHPGRTHSLIRTRERVKTQIGQAEGHLEYLRAFERHYRTKLQAFVEGQLHELYAPEMRQQAEDRIRELREQADTGGHRWQARCFCIGTALTKCCRSAR